MEGLRSETDPTMLPPQPPRICAEPGCKTKLSQSNKECYCRLHLDLARANRLNSWDRPPAARPAGRPRKYGTPAERIRRAATSPALEAMHEPLEIDELPEPVPVEERSADPTAALAPKVEASEPDAPPTPEQEESGKPPEQAEPRSQPAGGDASDPLCACGRPLGHSGKHRVPQETLKCDRCGAWKHRGRCKGIPQGKQTRPAPAPSAEAARAVVADIAPPPLLICGHPVTALDGSVDPVTLLGTMWCSVCAAESPEVAVVVPFEPAAPAPVELPAPVLEPIQPEPTPPKRTPLLFCDSWTLRLWLSQLEVA